MNPACPYCRADFESQDEITTCSACATPHHGDCYSQNGGCTVFGCECAPQDEPPIRVLIQELDGPSTQQVAAQAVLSRTVPAVSRREVSSQLPTRSSGYYTPDLMRASAFPLSMTYAIAAEPSWYGYTAHKSRLVYVLLAVFLGAFGGHNFYAGYAKKGTIQLCTTVFTFFYGALISWIWAIVDACTVIQDNDGVLFG